MSARKKISRPVSLLVATRKGAFFVKADASRRQWKVSAPIKLGQIAHHLVQDPRNPKVILFSARTGHLGPTMFRSVDRGRSWQEASRPPAFPKVVAEGARKHVLDHIFWLTPGHASEPGVWYGGASPQGLFRSEDGGDTWEPVSGLNDHPEYSQWMGAQENGTPDGPKLHSVIVDPRDRNHLYVAMSSGGVHESLDRGATWRALVKGMAVVEGFPADQLYVHDPHCLRLSPNPDRLYQQNHCGIYRLDRPGEEWLRIGNNMPKKIGDIGFPMVVHPRDDRICWVFPMDGGSVWPRTAIDGKPAAYGTRNAGKSWQRLGKGLPVRDAWWTVKRQAMCGDARDPVGLYVGTTSGEIWASRDEGRSWKCIARHLPEIYALETAEL